MWAVVGLGNPGRGYAQTRHNAGFLLVRRVARAWRVRLKKRIFLSKAVEVERKKEKVFLAMPQTYMNNSGQAVRLIIQGRAVDPEHLVVVYDDLDIPLGDIRIRKRGGPGSHRGLTSVLEAIGTTVFPRIRVGIGPLEGGVDATEYVLSAFEREEKPRIEEGLVKAHEALELILDGEIDRAMNLFN